MDWFRFYTETIDNRKIQTLPSNVFKVWVNFLCLCRIYNGVLPAAKEISFRLRCSESQAQRWTDDLISRRLLDRTPDGTIVAHDWNEYQFESDSAAERMRRHRANRKRSRDDPDSEQSTSALRNKLRHQFGTVYGAEQRQKQKQTTTTELCAPSRLSATEWMEAAAAVREFYPSTEDAFILGIVQETIQLALSRELPPERVTDDLIAKAIRKCKQTAPNQTTAGLFRRTVPQCVVSWLSKPPERDTTWRGPQPGIA